MKPKRMIKTGRHDGFLKDCAAVRNQRGIEQRHIRGIGEHALMNGRLVGQLAGCSYPHVEAAAFDLLAEIAVEFHRP